MIHDTKTHRVFNLTEAMYNSTLCIQAHKLPQSHCADKLEAGDIDVDLYMHIKNILYSNIVYIIYVHKNYT